MESLDLVNEAHQTFLPLRPFPMRASFAQSELAQAVARASSSAVANTRHAHYGALQRGETADRLKAAKRTADHQMISEILGAIDQMRWTAAGGVVIEATEPLHFCMRSTDLHDDFPAMFMWLDTPTVYIHLPAAGRDLIQLTCPDSSDQPLVGAYVSFISGINPAQDLSPNEIELFSLDASRGSVGVEILLVAGDASVIDKYPSFFATGMYYQSADTKLADLIDLAMSSIDEDHWMNGGVPQDPTAARQAIELICLTAIFRNQVLVDDLRRSALPTLPPSINKSSVSPDGSIERIGPDTLAHFVGEIPASGQPVKIQRGVCASTVGDDGESAVVFDLPQLAAG